MAGRSMAGRELPGLRVLQPAFVGNEVWFPPFCSFLSPGKMKLKENTGKESKPENL